MFRVIIAGSRTFCDYAAFERYVTRMLSEKVSAGERIVILSGHCSGADAMGEHYAALHGFDLEVYPADFKRDGRAAGPLRNRHMAMRADALIAFWDGESPGTRNMIECARRADLSVRIKRIRPQA